jgi:hypothetical protein
MRHSLIIQNFQFAVVALFIMAISCTNKQISYKRAGIKCDEETKAKITDTLNKVYWENLKETKWKYKRIVQTGPMKEYSIETVSTTSAERAVVVLLDSLCIIKRVDIIAGSFD